MIFEAYAATCPQEGRSGNEDAFSIVRDAPGGALVGALAAPGRREARLVGVWVGDSRAYVVGRDGEVELLTDGSSRFRLGSGRVEPRPIHRVLAPGEVVLLLSDGAWTPLGPGTCAMLVPMKRAFLVVLGLMLLGSGSGHSQTLTDEQLAAVRRGAAEASLPEGPVTVPLVGEPTLPLVEVLIDGAGPFRLLLDLGSNVVLLRRDVVDAAGVQVVLDRDRSDIVRAGTLAIGSAVFRDVWMGAYDELDVDGVLGYNLLSAFPFTLDFPAQRLVLGRSEVRDDDPEYVVEDRLPYFPAVLGERELRLNPDTGAAEEMTVPADWEGSIPVEGEIRPGPMTFNNQTGEARVGVARLGADLRVGELLLGRPLVYFNPDAGDAWLGCGVLQHYVLSMDPGMGRYRLVPREW